MHCKARLCPAILQFVFILFIFASDTYSQIYISPSGNDNNDGVTQNNALYTLNKAISILEQNTTIYILQGTYDWPASQIISREVLIEALPAPDGSYAVITSSALQTGSFILLEATATLKNVNFDFSARSIPSLTVVQATSSAANISFTNVSIICSTSADSCIPLKLDGSFFNFSNLTIENGGVSTISNLQYGSMIEDSTFRGLISPSSCGGLRIMDSPSISIRSTLFANNTASSGAGLCISNSSLRLESVSCIGNLASTGSCFHATASNIDIIGGQFHYNTAARADTTGGGAVAQLVSSSSIQIFNASFGDNIASGAGGVFYLQDTSSITIRRSEFRRNSAVQMSGAIHVTSGAIRLIDSIFDSNGIIGIAGAGGMGSAVYAAASGQPTQIVNCSFTNHFHNIELTSFPYGSVYFVTRSIDVDGAIFANNSAYFAAGLYCGDATALSLKNSIFIDNRASRGAALLLDARGPRIEDAAENQFFLENNLFESNQVSTTRNAGLLLQGGAVQISGGSKITLLRNIFRDNLINASITTAAVANGVGANILLSRDSYVKVISCSFIGNRLVASPNLQAIGMGMRGTLSNGTAVFEIKGCLFEANILEQMPYETAAYNGGSLALTNQALSRPGSPQMINFVQNCQFIANRAHSNPAIFFFTTNWHLRDSIFLRNGGNHPSNAVAVSSAVDATRGIFVESTMQNCSFSENNLDSIDRFGVSTTDVVVRGDFCANPGLDVWHDLTLIGSNDFQTKLASISRIYANMIIVDCARLKVIPLTSEPVGAVVDLPTVFVIGGAFVDVTNATSNFHSLYITQKLGGIPAANNILIGAFDLNLSPLGVHVAIDAVFRGVYQADSTSNTSGSIIVRSLMEMRTESRLAFHSVRFQMMPGANVRYFVDPIKGLELDNSHIIVEKGGQFILADLANLNIFRGSRNSTLQIHGTFILHDGYFDSVDLFMSSTAEVIFLITNFWPHQTMRFVNAATCLIDRSRFIFDFSFTNPTTTLFKNQLLEISNSTRAGGVVINDVTVDNTGGYSVELFSTSPAFFVRVTQFYPSEMLISDDGATLNLKFLLATNAPASGDCTRLFSALTLSQMSSVVECAWKSDQMLSIRTTTFPTNVSLIPGAIWDKRDPSFTALIPSTEIVYPPQSPLAPVVHITAPRRHPACSSLILDASNSYYIGDIRRSSYQWSLTSHSSAHPVFVFLATQNSSRVVIPATLISAGETYAINLNLTNSFGRSASARIIVLITEIQFSVSIEGPAVRQALVSSPLRLYGLFDVPSGCNLPSSAIERRWSISGASIQTTLKVDDFSLEIPANALLGESTYFFNFTAYPVGLPNLASSQQVQVMASSSPLSVAVSGSTGLVSTQSPHQITALLQDPDRTSSNTSVLWRWNLLNCPGIADFSRQSLTAVVAQIISVPGRTQQAGTTLLCTGFDGNKFNATQRLNFNTATLAIPSNLFGAGETTFSVTVTDPVTGRSAAAIAYLNFTSSVSSGQIKSVSIVAPSSDAGKILPQEKLVLRACLTESCVSNASVSQNIRFQWKSAEIGRAIPAQDILTPLNSSNFVLREGTLLSGQLFEFSVDLYDAMTDSLVGSNTIFLLANEAPATGFVQASSGSSNQFDAVEFFAPAWNDRDLPLRYVFSLIQDSREVFLTELIDSPVARALVLFSGSSELRVRVFDRQGAMAIRRIGYNAAQLSTAQISERVAELVSSFRQRAGWGDFRGSSQIAIALLEAKRQDNDASTSLLRDEILSFISSALQQRQLAWVDSPSVINLLSLLTNRSYSLSTVAVENCTRIIEDSVAAASSQVPAKLSVTSSQLARFSTVGFLQTAMQVARTVTAASQSSSAAILIRLRAAIEKLVLLQSRFIVADEAAAQIVSESISAASVIASGKSFSQSGGAITVSNATIKLVGSYPDQDIQIGVITWTDGAFGENTTKVIQILLPGGTGGASTATVSAQFDGQGTCAVFVEATKTWDYSACISRLQPGSSSVVCECSASGSSRSITMSLLFVFPDNVPSGTPESRGDAAGGAPVGAIVGAIFGVIVALVIIAVLVVLLVPSIKAKVLPYNRSRLNDGQELQSVELDQPRSEPSRWEPGAKSVQQK